jgi:hypothetical protein
MKKICPVCGRSHEAQRISQVYCSNACRKQAFLQKTEGRELSGAGSVLRNEYNGRTIYSQETANRNTKQERDEIYLTDELKLYIRGVIEETACMVAENVVGILITDDRNGNGEKANAKENGNSNNGNAKNRDSNATANGNEKNGNATDTGNEQGESNQNLVNPISEESQMEEEEDAKGWNGNGKNENRNPIPNENGKNGNNNANWNENGKNGSSNTTGNNIEERKFSQSPANSGLRENKRDEKDNPEKRSGNDMNQNSNANRSRNDRNGNSNDTGNGNDKSENGSSGNAILVPDKSETIQQAPYDDQYSPFILKIGNLEEEREYQDLFCSPQRHLPEEAQKPFIDISPYVLCAIEETLRLADEGKVLSRQVYFLKQAYLYILKRKDFRLIRAIFPATDLMLRMNLILNRLCKKKENGKVRLVLSRDIKAELIALRYGMAGSVTKHKFYNLFNKPLTDMQENASPSNQ